MKPSLEKLQKIFKLEAERGYDNRAVVGGLEQMLEPWEAEARVDGLPEDLIEAVDARLRDYPRLSSSSRQEALQGLWRRIKQRLSEPSARTDDQNRETESAAVISPPLEENPDQAMVSEPPEVPLPAEPSLPARAPEPPATLERPYLASTEPPAALNAPVTVIDGIGPKHAETLARLGLQSLGDMLYCYPRRYDDYTQLKPINRLEYGEEVTVIASVTNVTNRKIQNGKLTLTEAVVTDGSGALRITWFNQPWIARRLRRDLQLVLSGKVEQYLGRKVMNNPEMEQLDQQNLHTNRIVPVYSLTANITQRWLRKMMHQVVTYWAPRVADPLPESLIRAAELLELPNALLQIHFPDSWELLSSARHRLAFDEIFLLQLGMLHQKRAWQERSAHRFEVSAEWLAEQISRLPFTLTQAQINSLTDLRIDLASGQPMNRLIQGDVGSGKTIIAALGIAIVAYHQAQSALMAPTSILAEQHHSSLTGLLAGEGGILREDQVRMLIGSTPEAEKEAIRAGLASGEIKLVIGTHALIEDPVVFSNLELVIVDEQHRFGVDQRAALRQKGESPHLLVMTATPIPRSLALTIYGDLDLSVMDEMPPGRQEVATYVLTPLERERAYSLIRSQVAEGHQAFIIYPLVEESDKSDSKAAVEEYQRLQVEIFPDLRLGLLHGRLRPEEKEQVMAGFRDGNDHILVSTSVVEVGVDIPNATVMLIEGANRFGLAQLHQFRGRVGRGGDKSYCLLIPESRDSMENERLAAMAETNDGFVLAERDLEQRGPGEFLGTRQSGYSGLQFANLADVHLIEKARHFAKAFFEQDPDLALPENRQLVAMLDRNWGDGGDVS